MSVIVRSSPLHGAGVYTTAPFKKGQRVLEYTGPRLTTRETEGMYAENEVTYLFSVNDETVIDGFGTAAFVNHSCSPNCETPRAGRPIFIVATRYTPKPHKPTYHYHPLNR